MRNLKTYLKHIGSSLMVAMTADGYRRTLINDQKNNETDKIVQETIRRSVELTNKLGEQVEQNVKIKTEIENHLNQIKTGLDNIKKKVEYLNTADNKNISENFESLTEESSKVNTFVDKVLELISTPTSSSSLTDYNVSLQIFIDKYYQFFDSLTTVQKGALAHTLFCIGLLFCIFDILVAYYSDKLIIYLNLESKYPKIAKYIQLRRKFQNYYIKLNFILIILLTFFVLYTNVYILIYIN